MTTYSISIRDRDSRPLFKRELHAPSALEACNMALMSIAPMHGGTPVSHLSLWCEERPATTTASAACTSGEALTLQ